VDEDKTSVFSKGNYRVVGICSTYQNSWVILVHYLNIEHWAYNKARHGDGFFVAASPSLQSRACWRR